MQAQKRAILAVVLALLLPVLIAAAEPTVWVTPTGEAYHSISCRTIKRSKKLTEMTVSQAKAKGYRACKVCKP